MLEATDALYEGLPEVTVALQAGGESRRMGRSKATVPFCGRPLLCRMVERVDRVATEILITTNEPQNLTFLQDMPQAPKIRLVRDLLDYRGSLAGLFTALSSARYEHVAVCACDMYGASANLFATEVSVMREGGFDIVAPVTGQGFEPFHAVYRRDVCLARLKDLIAEGKTSMKALVSDPELNIRQFTMGEVSKVPGARGCFANCNTPSELADAERRVLGL